MSDTLLNAVTLAKHYGATVLNIAQVNDERIATVDFPSEHARERYTGSLESNAYGLDYAWSTEDWVMRLIAY